MPTMPIWKHRPALFVSKLSSFVLSDGVLRAILDDASADGSIATLYQNGAAIGRALVKANEITITPEGPLCPQCGPLSLSLDNDGFVPQQLPLTIFRPPGDVPR